MTPEEWRALRDLADQLIEATDGHAYWINRARDTALELRERLDRDRPDSAGDEDGHP